MRTFDRHVAKRIHLTLNRFLQTKTELEHRVLGRISILRVITELGLDEDRMERLEIVKCDFHDTNLLIVLPIFVFDAYPEVA